jgi:3-oxoisoapionate decarboxylase
LEDIARKLRVAAPRAEAAGVKLALENHIDSFSSEVLWLIDQVNHPSVGACVDTVNALLVTEDPMVAIENLAPRAFTNHFKDHRIEIESYGCRLTGVALGDGDIDLKRAYQIIRDKSSMKRINIEVELDAGTDAPDEARRREREAVKRSIRYCREVLHI